MTLGQNPNPGEIQIESQRGLRGISGSPGVCVVGWSRKKKKKEGDHEEKNKNKKQTSWPFGLFVLLDPFVILLQGKVGHLLMSVTPRGPAGCQKTPPAAHYYIKAA